MSDPRPGFAAGFVPSLSRALRNALPGRKALVLLFVLLVPPLLILVAGTQTPEHQRSGYFFVVFFLYLQFLVPLTALLFGTEILLAEASGGSLPYLFTRPVPRSSILLGKYVAYLIVGWLVLSASLAGTLAAYGGATLPAGLSGRTFLAIAMAYPAYLAAFAFLSAFTRWSLLAGFLYAFGVEFFLGVIPGMIRKGTMLYYSRSLLGDWEETPRTMRAFFGPEGPAGLAGAILTLLIIAAVCVALSTWIIGRREFVERNPGRA